MTGDLVYIGDVHLDRDDPHLAPFLAMLERLTQTVSRIVLVGDLFNLWIGRRELEQPHQEAVIQKFAEMRDRGITVKYIEGNRDYRIAPGYRGRFLDDATAGGIVEEFGGHRILAIHGDLTNPRDHQYRTWRRMSRSRPFWWLFNAVPRGRRFRVAEWLERRMRSSNLQHKRSFPENDVRRYAATYLATGIDTVVLGHFHVERDLVAEPPSPPGRIVVLPEWKGSRRYLKVSPGGEIVFAEFDD